MAEGLADGLVERWSGELPRGLVGEGTEWLLGCLAEGLSDGLAEWLGASVL